MFRFLKKKPLNVYKVTYIPWADIDLDKGEVVCQLSNMKEAFVEAANLIEAQKIFADMSTTKVMLTPHIYIDRIVEVLKRS